jgi:integrase
MENKTKDRRQLLNKKRRLLRLSEHCNLFDPESVTKHIDTLKKKNGKPITDGYRVNLYSVYVTFCEENQIPFDRPKINAQYPIPIIPTTSDVEKILSNTTTKYATIIKIMIETAVEGAELEKTHRNNIDTEQGKISISGSKGHANAVYKLKTSTQEMLRQYLAKHPQEYPFPKSRNIGDAWRLARERTAKKLCELELLKIQLKNLRNYAGAIFYKTAGKHDPIATMRFMRHKQLQTTLDYIRSINLDEPEEYITITIQLGQPDTGKKIVEYSNAGYDKLTEADGYLYMRTHKN